MLLFANWCRETNRVGEHDLDRLPQADRRLNPVRPRRALTEDELAGLLTVARTVRRGVRKGERVAAVRPDVARELDELGRERVLVYRTLVLTGLRLNELRTLTVADLDLTPGREVIRLAAANEKSGAGSTLPCGRTWPTNPAGGSARGNSPRPTGCSPCRPPCGRSSTGT